ncbi:MAG: hypothetical protein ABIY47_16115, partial [Opitutaceae bacterium]
LRLRGGEMSNRAKLVFFCLALGSVTAALLYRQRSNARLREAIEALHAQNREVVVMQGERERLIAASPARAAAALEEQELLALRAQILAQQRRLEAAQRPRPPIAPRVARPMNPPVLAPGMIPAGALQNVGHATPASAMQTGLWAQNRGETSTFMAGVAFDPECKAKMDELFTGLSAEEQQYFQSPERLVALLANAANIASDGGTPFPIQIVEKPLGPDAAEVTLRLHLPNGEIRDGKTLRLRRFADGWKVELPGTEADWVKVLWLGLPPTQRMRLRGN